MSLALERPEIRAAQRQSVPSQQISYFAFALCAVLYLIPFMRLLLQGTDEGIMVYGAVRVAHGQVPTRDFFEAWGLGTFYLLGGFFRLLGISFLTARIWLFMTSLGALLLIYFLARQVCPRYRGVPAILFAGASFGMLWPAISHHVDSNFFALLSVSCAVLWIKKLHSGSLLAAGIFAGATTCILQPKGMFLFLALLAWLWIRGRRESTPLLRPIAWVTGGYLGVVGLVLFYFWRQHSLWDLVYAIFIWPSRNYGESNALPYALGLVRDYWGVWTAALSWGRGGAALATVLIVPLALIAALPVLLPLLALYKRKAFSIPEISLYWLCGIAIWASEIHRKDICHLVFGSPLLLILAVFYLQLFRSKIADLGLQVLSIGAFCLAGFNFFLVLSAHPVATRVGRVAMFRDDPVLPQLEKVASSGSEIFAYPYCPMYYFLTATVNPTPYSFLTYGYNTPAQFQEAIRILDQHQVRYVLWNTGFQENALKYFFPSAKVPPPNERIMEPYLEAHYRTIWMDQNFRLMERRAEE